MFKTKSILILALLMLTSCARQNSYKPIHIVKAAEPSQYSREFHLMQSIEVMHKLNISLHKTIDELRLKQALAENKISVLDKTILKVEQKLYTTQIKYKESLKILKELEEIEVLIRPIGKKEVVNGMASSTIM